MKISDVVTNARKKSLTPMQERVLEHLKRHHDEVFSYRDLELAKALGMKQSALGFTLWGLAHKGLIKSFKVDKIYFGWNTAIDELERQVKMFTKA